MRTNVVALAIGYWMPHPSRCRTPKARPICLTSGEFKLLEVIVTRANRVLTRDQLMDALLWPSPIPSAFDRSIDVCVGRLRKKLHDDPRNPAIIRTVRNGGYIFAASVTRH